MLRFIHMKMMFLKDAYNKIDMKMMFLKGAYNKIDIHQLCI